MDRMKPKPNSRKRRKIQRSTSDPLIRSVKKSARSARAGGSAVTNSLFSFSFFKLVLTGGVVLGFTALFFISGVFGGTRFNLTLNTNPNLEEGLVGHWTFDGVDTTNTQILDRSGNGNHGTVSTNDNSPVASFSNASGVTGTSFSFDIGTASTNRLVVVVADDESSAVNLSAATVDGKSCNLVGRANNSTGAGNHSEMWYCDEDDLGASAGSVTIAITGGDAGWATHAILFTDVSQASTTDFGIDDTSTLGDNVTVTGIDVNANGLVVMAAAHGDTGTIAGWTSPLIERIDSDYPTSAVFGTGSAVESSSQTNKSYVATFTDTSINRGSALVAVWDSISGVDSPIGKLLPGRIGQAFEFDGVDDYIDITSTLSGESYDDVTFSVWYKSNIDTVVDDGYFWVHKSVTKNMVFSVTDDGGETDHVRFVIDDGTAHFYYSTTDVVDREWHHLVGVRTSTKVKIYVDGVKEVDTADLDAGVTISGLDIGPYIGDQPGDTEQVDGLLDDSRYYNRALSEDEVQRLYQLGATTHINTTINTNPDLENGLVAHWTFDGSDMLQNAVDRSGNGNTGYLDGFSATTTVPGRIGQALDFDGVGDYVTILDPGTDSVLDWDTGDNITISSWVKRGSTGGWQPVLTKHGDTANNNRRNYELVFTGGLGAGTDAIALYYRNSGDSAWIGYASDSTYTDITEWHHYVFTGTAGTAASAKLYVDGLEVSGAWDDGAGTEDPNIGNGDLQLAITYGGEIGDHALDDVRVYNRALSADEVARLYQLGATTHINTTIAPKPDLDEGLVLYWTFDGPSISGTSATDRSDSGFTGTLTSGPVVAPGRIGQGLRFDGVASYVTAGDVIEIGTGDLSMTAWIKTEPGMTWGAVGGKKSSGGVPGYTILISGEGRLYPYLWEGIGDVGGQHSSDTGQIINDGEWYFVSVVWDRDAFLYRYVDGVNTGTNVDLSDIDGIDIQTAQHFKVGTRHNAGDQPFDGIIDDVRVYNRTLSVEEIQYLYNLGR